MRLLHSAHNDAMTPELVADLKQFITAAFLQQSAELRERLDAHDRQFEEIGKRFQRMDRRIDDLELKLDTVTDTFGAMLINHDGRIGKLEAAKA